MASGRAAGALLAALASSGCELLIGADFGERALDASATGGSAPTSSSSSSSSGAPGSGGSGGSSSSSSNAGGSGAAGGACEPASPYLTAVRVSGADAPLDSAAVLGVMADCGRTRAFVRGSETGDPRNEKLELALVDEAGASSAASVLLARAEYPPGSDLPAGTSHAFEWVSAAKLDARRVVTGGSCAGKVTIGAFEPFDPPNPTGPAYPNTRRKGFALIADASDGAGAPVTHALGFSSDTTTVVSAVASTGDGTALVGGVALGPYTPVSLGGAPALGGEPPPGAPITGAQIGFVDSVSPSADSLGYRHRLAFESAETSGLFQVGAVAARPGAYVVTGLYQGAIDALGTLPMPGTGPKIATSQNGAYLAFVDASGSTDVVTKFVGFGPAAGAATNDRVWPFGVALDASGRALVTGVLLGRAFQLGAVAAPVPATDGDDGFVLRVGASSSAIAFALATGPGRQEIHAVAPVPGTSETVITGVYESEVRIGACALSRTDEAAQAGAFVARLDADFECVAIRRVDAVGYPTPRPLFQVYRDPLALDVTADRVALGFATESSARVGPATAELGGSKLAGAVASLPTSFDSFVDAGGSNAPCGCDCAAPYATHLTDGSSHTYRALEATLDACGNVFVGGLRTRPDASGALGASGALTVTRVSSGGALAETVFDAPAKPGSTPLQLQRLAVSVAPAAPTALALGATVVGEIAVKGGALGHPVDRRGLLAGFDAKSRTVGWAYAATPVTAAAGRFNLITEVAHDAQGDLLAIGASNAVVQLRDASGVASSVEFGTEQTGSATFGFVLRLGGSGALEDAVVLDNTSLGTSDVGQVYANAVARPVTAGATTAAFVAGSYLGTPPNGGSGPTSSSTFLGFVGRVAYSGSGAPSKLVGFGVPDAACGFLDVAALPGGGLAAGGYVTGTDPVFGAGADAVTLKLAPTALRDGAVLVVDANLANPKLVTFGGAGTQQVVAVAANESGLFVVGSFDDEARAVVGGSATVLKRDIANAGPLAMFVAKIAPATGVVERFERLQTTSTPADYDANRQFDLAGLSANATNVALAFAGSGPVKFGNKVLASLVNGPHAFVARTNAALQLP